ncbi:MAG: adenine deaminase [Planctomycetota bacterium]
MNNLIPYARGAKPVDLLLKNCRMVNVLTAEIYKTSVAIAEGFVVGFGTYKSEKVIDLKGAYLAPGFIEGHIHIESSMLSPAEFSNTVLPRGTTTVVCDPHEIANVLGLKGIKYFLDANLPERLAMGQAGRYPGLSIYTMLPSCVPATDLETSGARLTARDLLKLARHPYVLGLAEMMNFPGVLYENKDVLAKLKIFDMTADGLPFRSPTGTKDGLPFRSPTGTKDGLPFRSPTGTKDGLPFRSPTGTKDGHAPGLRGKDLSAYISAGIRSDHESFTVEEALEKLRSGMHLMLREGTAARNLETLIKAVTPGNSRRCMLVSDDRHPDDLLKNGHLDAALRKAVRLGLDPITALQMVTINPAEYFGLKRLGAIAPGFAADLVVLQDLRDFKIKIVFKKGTSIRHRAKSLGGHSNNALRFTLYASLHLPLLTESDFHIRSSGHRMIKVIELIPNQIVTKKTILPALIKDGRAVADTKRDILKIAVIDRHSGKKHIGLGFVKGFGLKRGAIASTVAHDSHNLIVVGTSDWDMHFAAKVIRYLRGGQIVVSYGRIMASLPLPNAGIMSDRSAQEVAEAVRKLNLEARKLGCRVSEPFMPLSFLALPVIPDLKITDKGLVDVTQFRVVGLFERS